MKKKIWVLALILVLCVAFVSAGIVLSQGDFESLSGWRQTAWVVFNREKLKNMEFVGTPSTQTWSETEEYSLENTVVLQKEPGKDFVVMNLTDLHLNDFDYFGANNGRIFSHIRAMVEANQPDLITISGDLFCTDSVAWSVHQFTNFMDSLGVYWAPVFGNHDDDGHCDQNYLADVMCQSQYCLLQKGDPAMGVGNYIINICEGDTIVHSMIMMDSHDDGLHENQYGWYRWAAEGANAPSSVILHIPILEYQLAYEAAWDGDGWKDGFDAFGSNREGVYYENGSEGFFQIVKDVGLTQHIICGHDHINNFSILYEGVRLTYSMRLGFYYTHHPDHLGATMLTIDEDGNAALSHVGRYE